MKHKKLLIFLFIITLLQSGLNAQEFHSLSLPDSFLSSVNHSDIFGITPATVLAPRRIRIQNNFFYFKYEKTDALIFTNEIEYAISRLLSLQITTPIVLKLKQENEPNRPGLGKIRLHADIRWFLENNFASILRVGIDLPTTTIKNSTIVGFAEPSILLQYENIFLSRDWFVDFTIHSLAPAGNRATRQGYNCGHFLDFARAVYYGNNPEVKILLGIIFYSGYFSKNKIKNKYDFNTGGFDMVLGPLFSISRNDLLWDIRIGYPLCDRNFGIQQNLNYTLATSLQFIF